MKYVWIVMLIIADLIWWVLTIINIKNAIKEAPEKDYCDTIIDYVDSVISGMEAYAFTCILIHLFGIFIVSFGMYISAGGDK